MKFHHQVLIDMIRETAGEPKSGVEIGVFKAEASVELRRAFPDCELLLVDPWQEWAPGTSYHDKHKRTGKLKIDQWNKVYAEAQKRMAVLGGTNRLMRCTSSFAAKVDEGGRDFVFIDANHTYDSVKEDITIWLPRIRKGGLICGHDFQGRYRGVKKAVHELLGKDNTIVGEGKSRLWGCIVE